MPSPPQQFLNSLRHLDHFDEKAFVKVHEEEMKITSIRLNPYKKTELDFELNEAVNWCSDAFYLNERPSFTHDPLFQAGCYYVQEAGSMFLEYALKQCIDFTKNLKVLDLCASPGGKSTLINSMLNEESLLVANELIKSRADVLAQNLSKWGTSNTVATNNDPQRFSDFGSYFDLLVIDAPCSGSGLFRKQPDAIDEWSENNVAMCSIRQRKILSDALPCLKEDGLLFYSTCSYSEEENEKVVNYLIEACGMEFVSLSVEKAWGIVETGLGYRFYPNKTQSEGFFCALLRKTKNESTYVVNKKKQDLICSKSELEILSPFLKKCPHRIIKKNDRFHLTNNAVAEFLIQFDKQFYFKKAGSLMGEIKGKDMVPDHELALSVWLSEEINACELSSEEALKFLKKESFLAHENAKGLQLIRFKKQGLGWAKILQNRINNYLPNGLRILK